MTQKMIWHPNIAPSFLLLYVITDKKTLKLTKIDRLLAASKIFPAQTRSNNSGRYLLIYIYLGCTSATREKILIPVRNYWLVNIVVLVNNVESGGHVIRRRACTRYVSIFRVTALYWICSLLGIVFSSERRSLLPDWPSLSSVEASLFS